MARIITFNFPLAHGLHARPACLLQEIAGKFTASISWENKRANTRADLKSVLSLIASDTWKDDPCQIIIDGADEQEAETTLQLFLENEFRKLDDESPGFPTPSAQEIRIPRIIQNENPLYFAGAGANRGIVKAPAFIFNAVELAPPIDSDEPRIAENEIHSVHDAIKTLERELKDSIEISLNSTEKDIINAHLAITRDPAFLEKINEYIIEFNYSAAGAVYQTAHHFATLLQNSRSFYIRQRLADINDISSRILSLIPCEHRNPQKENLNILTAPSNVIAENILPSQFISLDKTYLKGLVLSEAGAMSHCVILARAFNIPTITGIDGINKQVAPGEDVIVDAGRGLVILNPNHAISRFYDLEMNKLRKMEEKTAPFISAPGATSDGNYIEVAANIGGVEELKAAFLNGAEGAGLFRTEFLFMNRSNAPSEDEQFEIYSQTAQIAAKRPVIIRTLDVGGDKPIPYLNLPKESNPFLGYRAIRIYDDFNDLITSQLRAILRASIFGNLKIMFPMVSGIEEVLSLKNRLKTIMSGLEKEGIPFNSNIPVGVMVEIPSIAFAITDISREVDFFSVGSNDLSQYFYAADRANPNVEYLYQSLFPSFLRLLKKIIDDAHSNGKWIGLCGEIAGNLEYLPIWVGLGFDEISMSSSSIPSVKYTLKKLFFHECESLELNLLQKTTAAQLDEQLTEFSRVHSDIDLISVDSINLDSESASREEAIRELVNLLDLSGRIVNGDEVEDAVWKRESVYSTGVGFNVAIPHCQSPHVKNNSIAFLKLKKPIDWQSLDDLPVDMVILLAIRASDHDKEHLKILANLSRKLMDGEFRDNLRNAKDPDDLIKNINKGGAFR